MHLKNTPVRKKLAAQLRELRSWPPLQGNLRSLSLRRPVVPQPLTKQFAPISLADLLSQCSNHLEHEQEMLLAQSAEGADFKTQVANAEAHLVLSNIYVAVHEFTAMDEEPEMGLVLFRNALANDDEFAAHLTPIWDQYLRDSLVVDDMDVQYHEFLRLKAIYEPTQEAV